MLAHVSRSRRFAEQSAGMIGGAGGCEAADLEDQLAADGAGELVAGARDQHEGAVAADDAVLDSRGRGRAGC